MRLNKYWFGAVLFLASSLGSAIPLVPAYAAPACITFSNNLHRGMSGSEVTVLQTFLATQGYFAMTPTGYFGPITFSAVQKFQSAKDISATGYVGVLTRTAIGNNCGTPPPANTFIIRTLTPSSGPVGTSVSITGFGFNSDNTILLDGSLVARGVPISSSIAVACTTDPSCVGGIRQTITFVVPTSVGPNCPSGLMIACPMYQRLITPGTYLISVQNSAGTSNTLPFTVTGATSTQTLSITGLDAPATLSLGTPGTWTVHVSANNSASQLHYSVIWGDEVNANASIMAPTIQPAQTSATFTHAYQRSGTYTLIFTVADDNGNSVSTSNTLTVTPLY